MCFFLLRKFGKRIGKSRFERNKVIFLDLDRPKWLKNWNIWFQEEIAVEIILLIFLGSPRDSNIPPLYFKLDFVGVEYVKEYEDKSSQEFKKMSCDVEKEVEKLISFILWEA